MSPFIFVASAMCLLASILIILPLRRQTSEHIDRASINVKLFNERRKELDAENERGLIDAQQFSLAIEELERGLMTDISFNEASDDSVQHSEARLGTDSKRFIVIVSVLFVPIVSFLLYFKLGSFEEEEAWVQLKNDLEPIIKGLERGEDRQADLAEYPIKDIAAVLQARLQQDEGSPQSWLLLGLLYSQANKMDVAITAFEKATQEAPDHPNIKIAYAEALIKQNNGNMGRASIRLLQEALQLSPDNPRALTVMGMGLYNSGLYQQAIETWQRLLALRGESSERAPLLRKAIQTARQAMAKSATDGSNIARQSRPNGEITASNSLSDNEARLRQLVMQERRLTPEIEALLKAIFESDADNSKALAFQGMLSFNSGQYQRAIDSWEALLKQREPGSERRKLVESSIEKARAKLAEAE